MKHTLLAVFVILLAACGREQASPSTNAEKSANPTAEAQSIRNLNKAWNAAFAERDLDFVANLYAKGAFLMPPNQPPQTGKTIRKTWSDIFALPGFSLNFDTSVLELSDDATLAYDLGEYELGFDSEAGPVTDKGKYVVVWKKVNQEWKIAADIFNSNLPVPTEE